MAVFSVGTDDKDENRSNRPHPTPQKSKTAMNSNSITAPVFYLSFSSISLISFHEGLRQGSRNFSRAITQETTLPQEEKWREK